jgi:outer membrane murein-binding lipoprotein Lpp
LTEIKYADFKTDSSVTTKQKINNNISEVNRLLAQVEQLITHAGKLKIETSADQSIFYKNTFKRFNQVSEKMNRLQAKIRELTV